jgi:outer membrane immunogenic protein
MKSYILVAAACCLVGPAVAGGPIEPIMEPQPVGVAVVPSPSYDWTGAYVGLSFGRGTASDDGGLTETDTDLLGLQVGYLRDLGTLVVGGELAHVRGGYDAFPGNDWNSTRAKLIGGFDAGRFLPYGFVGLSSYNVTGASEFSDTVTIYGLGAKFGVTERLAVGLEYLVENKDDFDTTGDDLESSDLSLRLDYRF